MEKYLFPPKTNYPPLCPGDLKPCKRGKCDINYCWDRVFLSIPYGEWYEPYKMVIVKSLKKENFVPEEARVHGELQPLSMAISKSICSSAHAIVDISGMEGGSSATGVLMESGFLRATIGDVIHVAQEGSLIPAEAKAFHYSSYKNVDDLELIVTTWIKNLKKKYLDPMKHIIFNVDENKIYNYQTWLHCLHPVRKPEDDVSAKKDWDLPEALSGGWSGYKLIENTFNSLKPASAQLLKFRHCSTEEIPPFKKKPPYNKVKNNLQNSNLYLLDSPITRSSDGQEQPVNWVMHETMKLLKNILFPPLSVKIEIIDSSDPIRAKMYTKERVVLKYRKNLCECATTTWDYGFIVRAPNPFNPKAIVLMMAGIHAPASHAAAEIFFVPSRIQLLIEKLKLARIDTVENKFFEGVFRVHRTFLQEDLGDPELLHIQELRKID